MICQAAVVIHIKHAALWRMHKQQWNGKVRSSWQVHRARCIRRPTFYSFIYFSLFIKYYSIVINIPLASSQPFATLWKVLQLSVRLGAKTSFDLDSGCPRIRLPCDFVAPTVPFPPLAGTIQVKTSQGEGLLGSFVLQRKRESLNAVISVLTLTRGLFVHEICHSMLPFIVEGTCAMTKNLVTITPVRAGSRTNLRQLSFHQRVTATECIMVLHWLCASIHITSISLWTTVATMNAFCFLLVHSAASEEWLQ